MSEDSSEFKPLPRRSSKKQARKRQAVGAHTPSSPRQRSRARADSAPGEDAPVIPRTRRKARARKNRFGWIKYLALALVIGVGVYFVLNSQWLRPASETASLGASNITPSPLKVAVPASPEPRPFFPFLTLPGLPTAEPTLIPTATIPEVAIVAGHWAPEATDGVPSVRDSGAVCPDGLREVDITKSVADKTLAMMQRRGYNAVLLQEFDPRYVEKTKFKPRVFLSIHADSCLVGGDYAYATGYKIAHAEPSDNEEQDSRLVTCVTRSYDRIASIYNMPFNANTITRNMTEYHAFRKIDPTTPAAIIELGFLGQDREFLVNHQDEMARGLAVGLDDFLHGSTCLPPTATPEPTETTIP